MIVAETLWLAMLHRPPFRLQWGRDLIVAETIRDASFELWSVVPSMGPRLDSRGNPVAGICAGIAAATFNGAAT